MSKQAEAVNCKMQFVKQVCVGNINKHEVIVFLKRKTWIEP